MTDANLFEEFAKEALQQASKAKSENERLALNDIALAWVNAALASDRVLATEASSEVQTICSGVRAYDRFDRAGQSPGRVR